MDKINANFDVIKDIAIGETVFPQLKNSPSTETGRNFFLSWSHYIKLMRIENIEERHFNELDVEDIHKRKVMYFLGENI